MSVENETNKESNDNTKIQEDFISRVNNKIDSKKNEAKFILEECTTRWGEFTNISKDVAKKLKEKIDELLKKIKGDNKVSFSYAKLLEDNIQDEHKNLETIGKLIAGFDSNGWQRPNSDWKCTSVTKAGIRQNIWLTNLLQYLINDNNDKYKDVAAGVKNSIEYIKDYSNKFPIISETHKEKISNRLFGEYEKDSFDKKLIALLEKGKCYKEFKENENKNKKANFHIAVVEKILYDNEYRKYWDAGGELYQDIHNNDSKNIILYGAPGTGKTYSVQQMLKLMTNANFEHKIVQFHPSYSYEDFIDGIKPAGIENGQMKFELVNGHFKDFCIKAKNDKDKKYYFIIDEINRANLSAVFGELMYCLEYRYDGKDENGLVSTQNSKIIENIIKKDESKKDESKKDESKKDESKKDELAFHYVDEKNEVKFGIPDNVYIIGMMNDVDRSIDAFDLALRRRFKWKRMDCEYDVLSDNLEYKNLGDYIGACKNLNDYIAKNDNSGLGLGKSYEFGHSFFLKIGNTRKNNTKKITQPMLNSLFTDYLESTLKEYLRANVAESELDEKIKTAKEIFLLPK
ncbi:MAG: AAA family ATPase [Bacteroidota bacterium]|nr:AAA family ATPase [Bacteroidota bacterium]